MVKLLTFASDFYSDADTAAAWFLDADVDWKRRPATVVMGFTGRFEEDAKPDGKRDEDD